MLVHSGGLSRLSGYTVYCCCLSTFSPHFLLLFMFGVWACFMALCRDLGWFFSFKLQSVICIIHQTKATHWPSVDDCEGKRRSFILQVFLCVTSAPVSLPSPCFNLVKAGCCHSCNNFIFKRFNCLSQYIFFFVCLTENIKIRHHNPERSKIH